MKGKPEFNTIDQMIRSSAGPLSDTHVNVLLELQELEPDNAGIDYYDLLFERMS